MDKRSFLESLQMQLNDLTSEERREALEYYEEYFADAGEENEADVLISLGSPEQVAEQIKAGLHKADEGMFTENGYREKAESENPPEVYGKAEERQSRDTEQPGEQGQEEGRSGARRSTEREDSASGSSAQNRDGSGEWEGARSQGGYAGQNRSQGGYAGQEGARSRNGYAGQGGARNQNGYAWQNGQSQQAGKEKKAMNGAVVALLIVLGIFALPVILGLGAGLLGIIVGILGAIFGVIIAMLALILGLFVVGIGMFVLGFPMLFHNPFGGMLCISGGCIMIAFFILCVWLLVMVLGKFFPWLIREVESLGRYLSRKWAEGKQKGRKTI